MPIRVLVWVESLGSVKEIRLPDRRRGGGGVKLMLTQIFARPRRNQSIFVNILKIFEKN